jgi:hypothetical protein
MGEWKTVSVYVAFARRLTTAGPVVAQCPHMATMKSLDKLALALPEAEKGVDDGRVSYHVGGKYFCFHRRPRPDAVDPDTGERLTDVLVFRVADQDMKDFVLADDRGVWFTTPHWNGYPAVLTRIAHLKQIDRDELEERLVEAWLTRAKKRVANAWLAAHQVAED